MAGARGETGEFGNTDGSRGRPEALQGSRLYRTAGLLFLLALLFYYFEHLVDVLLIAFVATILAIAFNTIVSRIPLSRGLATGIVAVVTIGLIGVGTYFLFSALAAEIRRFMEDVPSFLASAEEWEAWLGETTGIDLELVGPRLEGMIESLIGGVQAGAVVAGAFGAVELVAMGALILIGAFFLVARPDRQLLIPLLRTVPSERRDAYRRIFERLGERISGWMWGTLVAMFFVGILSAVAYYFIGVPYPLLLGVLMGLFNIIPMIGPWIAGAIATIVTLFHNPSLALWVILAVIVIQEVESGFVRPMVMQGSVNVHPFVTLMSLLFFGSLFGIKGAVLALPITIVIGTFVEVLWVEETIKTDQDDIKPLVGE